MYDPTFQRCEAVAKYETRTGYKCCDQHAPLHNGKMRADVKLINETNTPRTYAAEPQLYSNAGGWVRADFARQLELELAHSLANQLKTQAEVERMTTLTEDCLNVIRVYCPTFYNDAMERFNKIDK
jgi:hypothetical protein